MIGHATTLDTCTRLLLGREPRLSSSMSHVMQKVPYCSMAVVEYNDETLQWQLIEPPCHPITNTHNQRFDWNILNL
jgi:ubiquitin-associated and SH3 domain-containing protein